MFASIHAYHAALLARQTTVSTTITSYLAHITQHNPTLQAILAINPDALSEADTKDIELLTIDALPPLFAVPIILKDTYTTAPPLPTTSGIRALRTLQASHDAPVVARLKAAGAIILAKANLHEFSLEGVTVSSLGGQTRNPYDLSRTPGGSSGGTAAALAAGMALAGCGGDTMNSLRSPASACALVGFRPTTGAVDTRGVIPVSRTQDAAGPLALSVPDVRIMFDVMRRSSTARSRPAPTTPKIGVFRAYFGDHASPDGKIVNDTIDTALRTLAATGEVELVELTDGPADWCDVAMLRETADTQAYEFREQFDAFLADEAVAATTPYPTLAAIVASGEYHREAVTDVLPNTLRPEFSTASPEYRRRLQRIEQLKTDVDRCFAQHGLDALVYPHQRQLAVEVGSMRQPGRNGLLASLTGRPAICLPGGFSPASETAPLGIPIGLELMGKAHEDDDLLDIAARVEGIVQARKTPVGF